MDKISELSTDIYEIYGKKFGRKKHKVFKEFLNSLNATYFYSKVFNIDQLICFKVVRNNRLILLVGSDFVGNFQPLTEMDIPSTIKEPGYLENIPVMINEEKYTENFWIEISLEGSNYIFLFTGLWRYSVFYVFSSIINRRFLTSPLTSMVRILETEYEINNRKRESLEQIANQLKYVAGARNVMHFIRNKVSPLANYFELLDELKKNKISTNITELRKIVDDEERIARREFKTIINKADSILDKSNDPLLPNNIKTVDIRTVVSLVRGCWHSCGLRDTITFEWKILDHKQFCKLDLVNFEVVVTDIVSNILKYSHEFYHLEFFEDGNYWKIQFVNHYRETQHDRLKELVNHFMSAKISPLLLGETNGLHMIKSNLDRMGIKHKMWLEPDSFMLHFDIYLSKTNSDG